MSENLNQPAPRRTEYPFEYPTGPGKVICTEAILRRRSNPDERIRCLKWRSAIDAGLEVLTDQGVWVTVGPDDLVRPNF